MMPKLLLLFFLFVSFNVFAQNDSTDNRWLNPHISGLADIYYRYNTSAPAGSLNNFTKFTNSQNTFALGMASLRVADTFSNVSAVADIGFGQRANEYNYTEANGSLISAVKELYMSYAISNAVKVTAGKWYKHIGYERPDADANKNYSMSYLFSFGPMSFTGLKADIVLAKKIKVMVGVSNPADIFTIRYSSGKTGIAGISFNAVNNKIKVRLNFQGYGGISTPYLVAPGYYLYKSLQQYDAVVQLEVNKKLDVVYNGTIQKVDDGLKKQWGGTAVYVNYKWKPGFVTTLRAEFLNDNKEALKIGADIFATTLTANFSINNRLRFMPEIRFDKSPYKIFQKGAVEGTGSTFTGLLAALYTFGKK